MSLASSRILHRVAALALLLVAAGAVFFLLVLPIIGHFSSVRSAIAEQRIVLGRLEAFAANKDAAETAAERAKASMRGGMLLGGGTDALRAANLQAIITESMEKNGVRLSSMRIVPPQEEDGLRLIGVQAEFETNLKQLQAIMAVLDARRPVLFVESVQIAPLASRGRGGDELKVRFGIFAAAAAKGDGQP
jgi:hypothetical protein